MSEVEFIPGLSAKRPHENAPDFVKAKISIKVSEMIDYLLAEQEKGEDWINGDLKVSKQGKLYISRDSWKPDAGKIEKQQERNAHKEGLNFADQSNGDFDDAIPF